ncbi:hypothetical protein KCP74_00185 [Salmonella enterica subsp. enterica]|nr:hypothetical protein KCP74_00185 [Salmonella enterica subsp. enterica]
MWGSNGMRTASRVRDAARALVLCGVMFRGKVVLAGAIQARHALRTLGESDGRQVRIRAALLYGRVVGAVNFIC